jgi:hypothetical protein
MIIFGQAEISDLSKYVDSISQSCINSFRVPFLIDDLCPYLKFIGVGPMSVDCHPQLRGFPSRY